MAIHHSRGIEIREPPRNLWRDAVLGVAAGVVGTMAMNAYWQALSTWSSDEDGDGDEERDSQAESQAQEREGREREAQEPEGESEAATAEEGPLDDISVVGPFHREGESSPETLARIGYVRLYDHEPSAETRKTLAGQIHWATGMGLGLGYGLVRGESDGLDLGGGLLFGAGAWFVNDEVLVPALGLSKGPTAHELEVHVQALGAHLVFGLATAVAAQILERAL